MDSVELVHQEAEARIETLFTNTGEEMHSWLSRVFSWETVDGLVEYARRVRGGSLGERGKYYNLVLSSPLHIARLANLHASNKLYREIQQRIT